MMRSFFKFFNLSLLWVTLQASAAMASEQVLLQFNFNLDANIAYQTRLTKVEQARGDLKSLVIRSSGAYCNISVSNVNYKVLGSDELKIAQRVSGSEFSIAGGTLDAVNVYFHQNNWDGVTCKLIVSGKAEEDDGTREYNLIGAVRYNGGFSRNTSLPLETASDMKHIQVALPSFCSNVQVLTVGTVVNNVFYKAELAQGSKDEYVVNELGQENVSSIQFSLNGPLNTACDIPVYTSAK